MRRFLGAAVAAAILVVVPLSTIAAEKDTLTVAFAAEPTTLDPVKYSAGVDLYGIGQIFEQLLHVMPDGTTANWLAESWKIDGTAEQPIIDVHIRPGVKFQNGDPLTSSDFEFSYQRLKDPAQSRWSHLQASVESFEIVDDLHFRLHFKQPDAKSLERSTGRRAAISIPAART